MVIQLRVNINSREQERLRRRLDPMERTRRMRNAMTESLQYLHAEVVKNVAVDSGRGRDSVQATPVTGQLPGRLTGQVGSSEVHMIVMELGRDPGSRPPPLGPIRLWMTRHGMDPAGAMGLSIAIGRRGIRNWPKYMFRNAARRGGSVIRRIVVRHLRAPIP